MFWRNILPPYSGLINKPSDKPLWSCACCLLHADFLLGLLSTLKMMETCYSKTSVDFHQTTWHIISQKTEFFITTAVRTSDRTCELFVCKTQCNILLINAMKVAFILNMLSWQLLFLNKASALWVWCLGLEVKKDMSQIRDEEACLRAKVIMLCWLSNLFHNSGAVMDM
jgi:hypothetical protein